MSKEANSKVFGKVRIHHTELPSTNDFILDLMASGTVEEGTLVTADHQTNGRGQHTNLWHSEAGSNLLLSTILYPENLAASQAFFLNKMTSLALVGTLARFGLRAQVKWPNDIFLNGGKVAGVLIQNSLQGQWVKATVIGIGLNVNQTHFPEEADQAISMRVAGGLNYDRNLVLDELTSQLDKFYFMRADRTSLTQWYQQKMLWRGEWHTFDDLQQKFEGKIEGIDAEGRLQITHRNGSDLVFDIRQLRFVK